MRITIAISVILMALQVVFWWHTRKIVPDMSIVPDVPGEETVQALSLGDDQFFFRLLALQLQNAGDTFGRFTALKEYDYNKLYHWFRLLDTLDDQSNYIPSMATYYFSQTQNVADVKYIVDYLLEHAGHRVEQKWWWIVQAVYLANHRLEDKELALEIAHYIKPEYDIPVWARQMPAFVHEKRGEFDAALKIIENIIDSQSELDRGELNFMHYFAKERLGKIEALKDKIDARRQALKKQHIPENKALNEDEELR